MFKFASMLTPRSKDDGLVLKKLLDFYPVLLARGTAVANVHLLNAALLLIVAPWLSVEIRQRVKAIGVMQQLQSFQKSIMGLPLSSLTPSSSTSSTSASSTSSFTTASEEDVAAAVTTVEPLSSIIRKVFC